MGRRLLILLLAPFFSILLFLLAFDYGAAKIVGSANSVKQILSDSGIYSSIVPSLLKQTGTIDTALGSIPATDPIVQQAATKALPATDIQKSSETAIDSIYSWLNGSIDQPNININLSGSKDSFANNLATEVQQKLSSLPTCTTPYTAANFDALNATCLPPGVSAATASSLLKNEVATSSDFLDKASINSSDLKNKDTGQTIFQSQANTAPGLYRRMKNSPPIIGLLAIILAAVLVFLRPTLASGLRHIGATLLSVGIAMMIFSWGLNWVVNNKITPNIKVENAAMQTNLRRAVNDLAQKIDKNYWIFGGAYTVAGAALVAAPFWIKPKAAPMPAEPAAAEPEEASPPKPDK